ncbi:MAG: lytic transglycosylase domain-containing protein [Thauera sp.]|nr:lytic transglycosylase domain-containing protein [Thauera sp.]
MRLLVLPLAVLITPLPSAANSLFGFIDETGVAHFSDFAADRRYKRLSGPAPAAKPLDRQARKKDAGSPITDGLRAQVARIADEHGLDPALALAVVHIESAGRSDARSPKGALGLMQLMPATAQRYGVADAFDADANLRGGIRYLRDLVQQFGSVELALAAYNAGEGAVLRHGRRIPPYAETQAYVPKVLARYAALQRENMPRRLD